MRKSALEAMLPTAVALAREGKNDRLWQTMGAHLVLRGGSLFYHFALCCPGAEKVFLVGDFCDWQENAIPMQQGENGLWTCLLDASAENDYYRYRVLFPDGREELLTDPAATAENPERGDCSRVTDPLALHYTDRRWIRAREDKNPRREPLAICRMNRSLLSPEGERIPMEAFSEKLISHCVSFGFTHVLLSCKCMGQGSFCIDGEYDGPEALFALVNRLHRAGLGFLAEIPFPTCREERNPIERSFLLSSLTLLPELYGVDGLYFCRGENPEEKNDTELFREFSSHLSQRLPEIMLIADDALQSPEGEDPRFLVGEPAGGGLGLTFLLRKSWMKNIDSLFRNQSPIRGNLLSEDMSALFMAQGMLPLAPGFCPEEKDTELLRLYYLFFLACPGKKFLEGERIFSSGGPENADTDFACFLRELLFFYQENPALYEEDASFGGFRWLVPSGEDGFLAWARLSHEGEWLLAVFSLREEATADFSIGVPFSGEWEVAFATRPEETGKVFSTFSCPTENFPAQLKITLPGLTGLYLRYRDEKYSEGFHR